MTSNPDTVEGVVREHAAKVGGAELTEGSAPPGDPQAVTLTLTYQDPAAFQVVVRSFPEGDALLWVGSTGSAMGPVELGPSDLADLSTFLDAVAAGTVELTLTNFRGKSHLTKISWPGGRWLVDVSVGAAIASLLGRRETLGGAR